MTMTRMGKAAGAAAIATLTLAVLPLVTATPAQADPEQCLEYLASQGYAGSLFNAACGIAAVGADEQAAELLAVANVPPDVVAQALRVAQQ
jgi:hypothetical protein